MRGVIRLRGVLPFAISRLWRRVAHNSTLMDTDVDETTQIALIAQKIEAILSGQNRIEQMFNDHEQRLRNLEKTTTEISARLTLSNMLQATFATISASVAAVIGWLK